MRPYVFNAVALAAAFVPITDSIAQPAPCAYEWQSLVPGYVSVEGTVRTAVPWDPDDDGPAVQELVVAGSLQILGSPSRVARFDGTRWLRMDEGLNPEQPIDSMTIWNGVPLASFGSVDTGFFIKAWSGTNWQSIGTFNHAVVSMVEFGGDLYVCGFFSSVDGIAAPTVARYDGTAWHALSETSPSFLAMSLTVFRGSIVVNGWGGLGGSMIRRWTGTNWADLAPLGIVGTVTDMAVYQNKLTISGDFESVNGIPATRVASFDGNNWSAMGVPDFAQPFSHVVSHTDRLFLLNDSFLSTWDTVQEWNGQEWFTPTEFADIKASMMGSWQGQLVVQGQFSIQGQLFSQGLLRWDGKAWHPLAVGEPVVANFAEALGDELVVGGLFSSLNGNAVQNLAAWNEFRWREIGGAPDGQVTDGFVHAGQLFVFGNFSNIGDAAVSRSARWDGSAWTSFVPRDQLIVDVNNLYRRVNDEIHRWTGADWVFDRSAASACGTFPTIFRTETYATSSESSGGPSTSWSWNRERNGECFSVFSGNNDRYNFSSGLGRLGVVGDVLVGSYSTSRSYGGFTTSSAWAWDGDRKLHMFGAGSSGGPAIEQNPDTRIRAINWLRGNLVVGGNFREFAASTPIRYAAQWNGAQWTELGEGVNGPVLRISKWRDKLVVVGEFSIAGGIPMPGIALWQCAEGCACDGDGDGIVDEQDACPGYNDATDSDADGVPDCLEPPPDDGGNDNSGGGNEDNPDSGGNSDDVAADLPSLNCGACGASAPLGFIAVIAGLLVTRGRSKVRTRTVSKQN